jgi:hypothetical protein
MFLLYFLQDPLCSNRPLRDIQKHKYDPCGKQKMKKRAEEIKNRFLQPVPFPLSRLVLPQFFF